MILPKKSVTTYFWIQKDTIARGMRIDMDCLKMTYKGFVFDVNPSCIKTEMSRKTAQKTILFSTFKTQDMGFEPVKISGKGCFFGDNAKENACELMRVFKMKGSAYLFVPNFPPIRAVFNKLNVSFNSDKNCADYSFEFVEDSVGKNSRFDFNYTYAFENENLYDIANRTNVNVDKIFSCNEFENIFDVKGGDKVWLN